MHHVERNVNVIGGLDLMYEREVIMIVFTVIPIALGIYFGYKAGYLYNLLRRKKDE